jgi:thiol-disulfide isomerase/thioredoxin
MSFRIVFIVVLHKIAMMKKILQSILLPVLILAGLNACSNAQNASYQLKGKVDKHPNAWLILEAFKGANVEKIDSVKTDNKGQFTFKKKVAVKDFYRLRTGSNNQVYIVLDPAEQVEYTNDGVSLVEKYTLTGSTEGQVVLEIKAIKNKTTQFGDSLNRFFSALTQEEQAAKLPELQMVYQNFMRDQQESLMQLIEKNSDKLAILIAAEQIEPEQDFAPYEKIATALGKNYSYSALAQQVINRANQLKKTAIGQTAPEINLPDPSGKNISLSSLRGKVVLIDFWASWCGPCRKENPNVVRVYQQYRDKGFEVFSVSLDRDKNSWIEAIKKDQLIWPSHVSDLAYWSSSVVPQYGFSGIPFTVLLNKEGKIVAKGLRGPQLEEKIATLLQN